MGKFKSFFFIFIGIIVFFFWIIMGLLFDTFHFPDRKEIECECECECFRSAMPLFWCGASFYFARVCVRGFFSFTHCHFITDLYRHFLLFHCFEIHDAKWILIKVRRNETRQRSKWNGIMKRENEVRMRKTNRQNRKKWWWWWWCWLAKKRNSNICKRLRLFSFSN